MLLFKVSLTYTGQSEEPFRWSQAQWISWREKQIRWILTPTFEANGRQLISREEVILRSAVAYQQVRQWMNLAPENPSNTKIRSTMRHFFAFIETQGMMSYFDKNGTYTHALGYPETDKTYWDNSSSFMAFPKMLRGQEFLNNLSSQSSYSKALEQIRDWNSKLPDDQKWIVLAYRSQFLKSADTTTYGRFLVYVPNEPSSDGGSNDRWIQFAAEAPGERTTKEVKSVSMVTIHRDPHGHQKAFLVDFMRERDSSRLWSIRPNMLAAKNPSKNCYDCHKSPVLPLYPKQIIRFDSTDSHVDAEALAIATKLNERITNYQSCPIEYLPSDAYGPSIGSRALTDDDIVRANDGHSISLKSETRIKDASRCDKCHREANSINYPAAIDTNIGFLNFEAKKGFAQTLIDKGLMPPQSSLSIDERRILWRCLSLNYLRQSDLGDPIGQLVDWLKES